MYSPFKFCNIKVYRNTELISCFPQIRWKDKTDDKRL